MVKKWEKYISKGLRKADSVAKVATKAYNIAKTVAEMINVEFKYCDTAFTMVPTTSVTVPADHITPIPQDDTPNGRDGDQVRVKSWETRLYATQHASATTTQLRVIWFIDLLPEGGYPQITHLLEHMGAANPTVNAPRNLNYRTRFVILKDKTFTLDSLSRRSITNHWYKKLDLKPTYSGDTGAHHVSKQLFMLALSTEASNYPTVYVNSRVRFLDN